MTELFADSGRVKVSPSEFVQKILRLNGEAFSLKDFPYLDAIYNTNAKEVGLFTARQVSKSTTLASKLILHAVTEPHGRQVLVTPLQEQAYVFATQRLNDFINGSPIVKRCFFDGPNCIDQMLKKRFNSNDHLITLGYAERTANRLRGQSAGRLSFDEVQDIYPEVIPVVKELTFRAKNPSVWYCGTPKGMQNHMEGMRKRSTGNQWAVRCHHPGCRFWNMRWDESNIGDTGVICARCKQSINTNSGQWVSAKQLDFERGRDALVTMESYRIPQLIVKPIMDDPMKWREILAKLRSYPTAQLYNEVFGLPYDSGSQPVSIEQLRACCDPERHNILPDAQNRKLPPLIMGVDWAFNGENSYTVVTIGGWDPFPTKFQLYYWKIFKGNETDSVFQIEWIQRIFRQCNIRLIGADWGAGHVQNLQLINALGDDALIQFFHTGMTGTGAARAARAKWEPRTRKFHLARTRVLTDTFETIRQRQLTLPRFEECGEFVDQIMNESLEFNEKTNTQRYTNALPDDCLHATTYGMLAGEFFLRGDFGGHMGSSPTSANVPEPDIWNEAADAFQDSMY
ncbi:MAG: phage terminase large subunit family protein [Gemmatimonadota bacterium]|nr:phage terminase large subunit family protein [Gemmatimonadota bacterium]